MVINSANLQAMFRGFRTIYMENLHAAKPRWKELAMKTPSGSAEEVYAWLAAFPGMEELVGEVTIKDLSACDYTIRNKEWHSTVTVKEADIERDNYGIYDPMFATMGAVAAAHPDKLMADLLLAGFGANGKDYTGTPFFSADKPRGEGKVKFSNNGTKKLSADNYAAARQNIFERQNAEGESMGLGNQFLLVTTPADEKVAREILIAQRNTAGADNVFSASAQLMVYPQLAAAVARSATPTWRPWFLLDVGLPIKPLILQMEREPDVVAVNKRDDAFVVLNHKFILQGYGRWNAGFGLPELAYGSTGAAAA